MRNSETVRKTTLSIINKYQMTEFLMCGCDIQSVLLYLTNGITLDKII